MLLNCHTCFSFGYGILRVEEMLSELHRLGHSSFVVSDINNTSAVLECLRLCGGKDSPYPGLRAIPGIDFRNGIRQQYIGIAMNNEGFRELNEHLTEHLHSGKEFESTAPAFANAYIIYPLSQYKGGVLRPNEFIGVHANDLQQPSFSKIREPEKNRLVVLQSATFVSKLHFNAHRLLRAISKNMLLSKLPKEEQASDTELFLSAAAISEGFCSEPEILVNTATLLRNCSVDFEFGKLSNKNLKHYTGSETGDKALLREKAYEGLGYRYPDAIAEVITRIEKELEVISKMQFCAYFLINWDIVNYARSRNYYYVGRGSGANSIVAYLLRITDVDPIDLDLYFERFINEHRSNAPDFDIDFSWTDRDDITRYIFSRFGSDRTALLATYSTYQHDAVTRELGKVFGLPPHEIDRLQQAGANGADDIGRLVIRYSELIKGLPSHLSIHASGLLISEEPLSAYTATFMPPKGYPTTQFSMLEAEDLGLFKFDILSQRGLGKIKDAVDLVRQNRNIEIDIHDIRKFKEDPEIRKLMRAGKCIGCFYVESPAMRMLLTKLQAEDYLRLVAASSIIRPGVSKSGMMREYILRFRDQARRESARAGNPVLYDLLSETFGVMVYQEDVIKIAHLFAGLSLADADHLRRGMSWKFKQRNEFWRVKEKFFSNCQERGYDLNTVTDIWTQIESFANFAFSKGHSASYAVESYQALYLKAHFPLEYLVATLNNGGGYYRKEVYVHEARMLGSQVKPPCVNNSGSDCTIRGNVIYLGLAMINGIEQELVSRIVAERSQHGPYADLYSFIKRTQTGIEQIRLLIRAGALHSLHDNKKELLWQAHMFIHPVARPKSAELFDIVPQEFKLPPLENSWLDDALDEIELLGFTLCSPFRLLREPVSETGTTSRDLVHKTGENVELTAYLVTVKSTRTSRGERMFFGTFLDREGNWVDTVHFAESARRFPFTGPGCYRISGKVMNEFDFIFLDVTSLERLAVLNKDDMIGLQQEPGRQVL